MSVEKAREILRKFIAMPANKVTLREISEYDKANGFIEGWDARSKEIRKLKDIIDTLLEYSGHTNNCIRSFWAAGEPTADGGYRMQYAGKWYQAAPVDKTPNCNCGYGDFIEKEQLF